MRTSIRPGMGAIALAAALIVTTSCGEPLGIVTCPSERSESGLVCANGTVRFNGIEGGFWQVVADGVAYDPHASLPAEFRVEGKPVTFVARTTAGACIHMAGPIVEILEIAPR